jgi:hypothetical protein
VLGHRAIKSAQRALHFAQVADFLGECHIADRDYNIAICDVCQELDLECFLRVACGSDTSFGYAQGQALSDALDAGLGSTSAEVKGDGQECPSHTNLPVHTQAWLSHTSLRLEHPGIVLLQAYLVAVLVLRIGLAFGSQLAAVQLAIAVDLMVQRGFFGFEMSGLAGSQLSGFECGSAMLLRARSENGLGMGTGDDWGVLLVIDGFRYVIWPVREPGAVGGGEASAIVFAHIALFGVHAGFFSFQAGGLAGGPLAVLDTGGERFLRMLLALLNCRLR